MNQKNLDKIMCEWKGTMIENQKGNGTTFGKDITKYTPRQLNCHFCSGVDLMCGAYVPRDAELIKYTDDDFEIVCNLELRKNFQDY